MDTATDGDMSIDMNEDQEIEYLIPIFKNENSYKIVSNSSHKIVSYKVSNLINSGWDLYKSLIATCCNDCIIYTQVLVKPVIIH